MEARARDELESSIRIHLEGGEHEAAATLALRGYGPEIYGFLAALHHGGDHADEVFALFAEGMWRALPSFGWQSSFRTWAFSIARRTSLRYRRDTQRRARRQEQLPESSIPLCIAAEVRTTTAPHLRSDVKSRVAELRESLPPEDQELLLLRVNRNLSWIELAHVLQGEDDAPLEGEPLRRAAARLRKRFQLVKNKLRDMASRAGLLDGEG